MCSSVLPSCRTFTCNVLGTLECHCSEVSLGANVNVAELHCIEESFLSEALISVVSLYLLALYLISVAAFPAGVCTYLIGPFLEETVQDLGMSFSGETDQRVRLGLPHHTGQEHLYPWGHFSLSCNQRTLPMPSQRVTVEISLSSSSGRSPCADMRQRGSSIHLLPFTITTTDPSSSMIISRPSCPRDCVFA